MFYDISTTLKYIEKYANKTSTEYVDISIMYYAKNNKMLHSIDYCTKDFNFYIGYYPDEIQIRTNYGKITSIKYINLKDINSINEDEKFQLRLSFTDEVLYAMQIHFYVINFVPFERIYK